MTEFRYLANVATLKLDTATCTGCGQCLGVCPQGVLVLREGRAAIGDRDRCMECGACAINCPVAALQVKAGVGCASAILHGWLTGQEPNCDCGGDSKCC